MQKSAFNEFTKQYPDLATFNLADYLANIKSKNELDLELIKYILDQNIDVNIKTSKKGISCFGLSLILESNELAKLLLSYGFEINSNDKRGLNAFHWATVVGNYEISKLLIEKGANIYANVNFEVEYYEKDISKPSTLDILVKKYSKDVEDEEIIDFDSNYATKTKTTQLSSFALAFNSYNPKIVQLLLEKGFDPNENVLRKDSFYEFFQDDIARVYLIENNPLDEICENNDVELLKLMLEKGATRFDTSNLFNACKNLNFEMIKIFVDNGVEINYKDNKKWNIGNPLTIVCANSTIAPVGEGMCGSNLDIKGSEVFEIIKYLIENGADVNIDSPLLAACSLEYFNFKKTSKNHNESFADINLDIIKYLIEKSADVNYIDIDGKSILMHAINKLNGYYVSKILVENGADVNHKDKLGNNVLMNLDLDPYIADFYNMDENEIANYNHNGGYDNVINVHKIIGLLIDNGININSKNNMGFTPLMKYSFDNFQRIVKILLQNGADINAKSEMTAFDLSSNDEIKELISQSRNNSPQRLVKLLSNFTIDKPIKYTTHDWDFGELKKEYKNFDGYMDAVKKQFETMKTELENLSPNLYKKIYTFLIEENPNDDYSWCHKTHINIGWSSLKGLKEYCDTGNKPNSFVLANPIFYEGNDLTTFGDIISLFKQEIEIRENFKNLETIFSIQKKILGRGRNSTFNLDLSTSKLNRQFYTDVEKFSNALSKIFAEIKIRKEFLNIEVSTAELEDRSIEIKIVHINSFPNKSANDLLKEIDDGDFAEIKSNLQNLCDWSIESCFENEDFRINYLHSNNVKDIEKTTNVSGFTHIFRFYK